jgi:D-alanyl-lipoteichoic acid acyltransferase DltB (MBOAT superfamily)
MLLPDILLLGGVALLLRLAGPGSARRWLVFMASALSVYWLQPALPVRHLDFWLPTATLALAALSWLLTAPPETRLTRANGLAVALLAGLVLLAGLSRYLGGGDWLLPSRPPQATQALAGLALCGAALGGLAALLKGRPAPGPLLAGSVGLVVGLLVWLKTPVLALEGARWLRALAGQNPGLAAALDVRWLGFSYVAFRLIHTLRDRQSGRLPAVDLVTYVSYMVFFPSFLAGPIDRLERFARDFSAPDKLAAQPAPPGIIARPAIRLFSPDERLAGDLAQAGQRLLLGLVKKFVLADTLGLIALNPANAVQVRDPGWLWLLLYLYAFQIYFDFAGYTDIAIGLGLVLGVKLPENFAAPYRKPNLTQFWNSWHMSLTQWFRSYFFNPFVRWLRSPGNRLSPAGVVLLSQAATMLLIGLWHGVTANFVLWGLWHGLGLFVQNRWTDLTRGWFAAREFSPFARRALRVFSTLLTFHYVALGWVWFLMPTPQAAVRVLAGLAGARW